MASDGKFDVRTIAKLLMLDERRIQQLVKEGWIPKGEDRGRYGLVESVQGYIRYLKEGSRESARSSEHARLARAQAMKVEMSNYKALGELIAASHVDETTQGLVVRMRSGLEALKGRLSNELAGQDPPFIYQRLEREHRAVLNSCADWLAERATSLDAVPEPSAHAEAGRTSTADELGGEQTDDAG